MSSPVHQLSWYGGQGVVAVVTDEGVTVLTETIMRCAMCGSLSVIQTDSHTVSIHITGSPNIYTENTGMLIQGLSVSGSCFVVWNGKTARVYRVDTQLLCVEALDSFVCGARAMVIADASTITDEALFSSENGLIRILNFSGVQKGSITFTDVEGAPEHLDINNCYLAVVTVKGIIQIHDIKKPTRPQLIGSAGKFTALPLPMPSALLSDGTISPNAVPLLGANAKSATTLSSKISPSISSSKIIMNLLGKNIVPAATVNTLSLKIKNIKVNCKGNKIAILADQIEGTLQVRHNDSRLHVFDHNKGSMHTYDFKKDKRCPISIFWDNSDERMLSCEAMRDRVSIAPMIFTKGVAIPSSTPITDKENEKDNDIDNDMNRDKDVNKDKIKNKIDDISVLNDEIQTQSEIEVILFFATTEHGLLMQDSFQRKNPYGAMLGFTVPRVYFRNTTNSNDENNDSPVEKNRGDNKIRVHSKVMRDFIGMDGVNDITKKALLDFSFNLTLGKLDEAYRAVKTIGSVSIWENMAQMCVKTKRLDVAEVCLGNMGHARGAAAVRESRKENSIELSIGKYCIIDEFIYQITFSLILFDFFSVCYSSFLSMFLFFFFMFNFPFSFLPFYLPFLSFLSFLLSFFPFFLPFFPSLLSIFLSYYLSFLSFLLFSLLSFLSFFLSFFPFFLTIFLSFLSFYLSFLSFLLSLFSFLSHISKASWLFSWDC